MKLSLNDKTFLDAMQKAKDRQFISPKTGRPKGAKDKQRRKNSRYEWDVTDLLEKFQARFTVMPGQCWIWTGATTRGFGYMVVGSRQDNAGKSPRVQAHRLSYILHLGDLEKRDLVTQKCGRKLCVNPRHLYTWRR